MLSILYGSGAVSCIVRSTGEISPRGFVYVKSLALFILLQAMAAAADVEAAKVQAAELNDDSGEQLADSIVNSTGEKMVASEPTTATTPI